MHAKTYFCSSSPRTVTLSTYSFIVSGSTSQRVTAASQFPPRFDRVLRSIMHAFLGSALMVCSSHHVPVVVPPAGCKSEKSKIQGNFQGLSFWTLGLSTNHPSIPPPSWALWWGLLMQQCLHELFCSEERCKKNTLISLQSYPHTLPPSRPTTSLANF